MESVTLGNLIGSCLIVTVTWLSLSPQTSFFWGSFGRQVRNNVAQTVKNLSAFQKTWVQSVEKGTETHSSIPAWRIPWTEEPGGLQSIGSQRVGHD